MRIILSTLCILLLINNVVSSKLEAQGLESQLKSESVSSLLEAAGGDGDARRGAVVFHQTHTTCTKCHTAGQGEKPLGPDLTKLRESKVTAEYLVESILEPSKAIKKGYESYVVVDADGKSFQGLLQSRDEKTITIRDVARNGQLAEFELSDLEEFSHLKTSIMPAGLANLLTSRQEFLDLVKYLVEVAEQGPDRAAELQPAPSLLAASPLPDYEERVDHRAMIESLDQDSFKRGAEIYNRLCINCHGTKSKPGSLPTSRRFATEKLKNGADPYRMYQTLTRGFGLMVAQRWMVPQQKYDVIHYIREEYLKGANESQYTEITEPYLASLPKGDTRGPAPSKILPWENMNYGHSMIATFEIGGHRGNFAYKGIATRLDPGPGGISQGRYWSILDHDTLRLAAMWHGQGFIDWNGINFNGRHGAHPRTVGTTEFANPVGPGWANPETGDFVDPRIRGRDGKPYGPLPRDWAHYKGLYHFGNRSIVSYTVGMTKLLESHSLIEDASGPMLLRHFEIGPRDREMILQVDRAPGNTGTHSQIHSPTAGSVQLFGELKGDPPSTEPSAEQTSLQFNGATEIVISDADKIRMKDQSFSIFARIKTQRGGTIFSKASPRGNWSRMGQTFFVRGGKLCYDIGWVGDVVSKASVDDGKWHDVAVTFDSKSKTFQLYVDGQPDNAKRLEAEFELQNAVLRIGNTSPNFPRPQSYFQGQLRNIQLHRGVLSADQLAMVADGKSLKTAAATWQPENASGSIVKNAVADSFQGKILRGPIRQTAVATSGNASLATGVLPAQAGFQWSNDSDGNVRLTIPAGQSPLRFTLWMNRAHTIDQARHAAAKLIVDEHVVDLKSMTHGSAAKWTSTLVTQGASHRNGDSPFAVDVFTRPDPNPWFCRVRLTGFDFITDDRAAISAWDGDVWLVDGVSQGDGQLKWQRIASGLFQPLGVKYVDNKIYVTCRDQIVILHDLNGDGETDYYESFNNDHQVTEHFHEFAMGLQTDDAGNFYYAKSARHALKAVVPHHGTLLRVSKDGKKTDILATGFRAANGVCINPDGTFIVTDQEGHWNPKNRINWVKEGGFYGNMYGYHDVTDDSDEAMEQPLCWITNAFDRSPAELLWVDSKAWGNLNGRLLNLSYGYGKVYIVPHESVDGQMQGGMCQLPIPQFPTGVMRGRFHPTNGQLYACGMFAWAGSQNQPGGFYRVRYEGKGAYLPVELHAKNDAMVIVYSDQIDVSQLSAKNFQVKTWSLKRTRNYGSKHYDEKLIEVTDVAVLADGRSVKLTIPEIKPTWCMEISYTVTGASGKKIQGTIHNTIHQLTP